MKLRHYDGRMNHHCPCYSYSATWISLFPVETDASLATSAKPRNVPTSFPGGPDATNGGFDGKIIYWLVVFRHPSEKYDFVSWDDYSKI